MIVAKLVAKYTSKYSLEEQKSWIAFFYRMTNRPTDWIKYILNGQWSLVNSSLEIPFMDRQTGVRKDGLFI